MKAQEPATRTSRGWSLGGQGMMEAWEAVTKGQGGIGETESVILGGF